MSRTKGALSKRTLEVKELVEGALVALGGAEWLKSKADENPAAFMALVGKLIPRDLKLQGHITHTLADLIGESYGEHERTTDDSVSARGVTH